MISLAIDTTSIASIFKTLESFATKIAEFFIRILSGITGKTTSPVSGADATTEPSVIAPTTIFYQD